MEIQGGIEPIRDRSSGFGDVFNSTRGIVDVLFTVSRQWIQFRRLKFAALKHQQRSA